MRTTHRSMKINNDENGKRKERANGKMRGASPSGSAAKPRLPFAFFLYVSFVLFGRVCACLGGA